MKWPWHVGSPGWCIPFGMKNYILYPFGLLPRRPPKSHSLTKEISKSNVQLNTVRGGGIFPQALSCFSLETADWSQNAYALDSYAFNWTQLMDFLLEASLGMVCNAAMGSLTAIEAKNKLIQEARKVFGSDPCRSQVHRHWVTKFHQSPCCTYQNRKISHLQKGDHEIFYFTEYTNVLHVCFSPNWRP